MAHHAFVGIGDHETGVARAISFVQTRDDIHESDITILRYGLFSVEDARKLAEVAYRSPQGGAGKAVIVSLTRFFHEAQNALLKLFEEPPEGTLLILVIPTVGIVLPTLLSRLQRLPVPESDESVSDTPHEPSAAEELLAASDEARTKIIAKLIDRTKADKPEEKQAGRSAAVELVNDLIRVGHEVFMKEQHAEKRRTLELFLADLSTFVPILHERSAPIKLIFEHILLVIPKSLRKA
jgi:hypothetical protein